MEFLYSISEAFKDLANPKIKHLSIINGIVWAFVWGILGLIFYSDLFHFTTWIINLLPFTFIKVSGAEFILILIWLQAVLISVGIFFALFNQLLSKKFISLLVVLIIGVLWGLFFWSYESSFIFRLERLIRIFPFESIEVAVANVLVIFIFYSFYVASIYISFLVLSPKVLEELKDEQYPTIKTNKNFSILKLSFLMIRDLTIFIIALFILYPLLFVPFLNLVIIIALWVFLIKASILEIVFMIFGKEKVNNKDIYIFSLASVVLNFIPVVNLFAPAFGVLSIYHYVMEIKLDKN
jgi:hypothetical protein